MSLIRPPRLPRLVLAAGLAALLGGCSSRSVTCSCTRPDGGTDLLDIKGGSCSEFENGQQGYTRCTAVVVFNSLLGPEAAAAIATPRSLPSLDRPWNDQGNR